MSILYKAKDALITHALIFISASPPITKYIWCWKNWHVNVMWLIVFYFWKFGVINLLNNHLTSPILINSFFLEMDTFIKCGLKWNVAFPILIFFEKWKNKIIVSQNVRHHQKRRLHTVKIDNIRIEYQYLL